MPRAPWLFWALTTSAQSAVRTSSNLLDEEVTLFQTHVEGAVVLEVPRANSSSKLQRTKASLLDTFLAEIEGDAGAVLAEGSSLSARASAPAPSPNMVRTGPLLKARSLETSNGLVILVVAVMTVLPLVGSLLDRFWVSPFKTRSYSWWFLTLCVASYIVWIPAIFSRDFSMNLGFIVPIVGNRIGVTMDEHDGYKEGPIRESTRTLIKLLWKADVRFGAVLIAFYAFAVPISKLLLLLTAEFLRFRSPQASRICIFALQYSAKWAAPDMYGYILLYYLVRHLQHLPVDAVAVFDVGFTCYSVFSVSSAVYSLAVPLPVLKDADASSDRQPPMALRYLGRTGVRWSSALLWAVWIVLSGFAIFTPCFGLRLDTATLQAHVPEAMKKVLDVIKLEDIVPEQRVSLCMAIKGLLQWFHTDHDLNLLLAFFMLLVFCVLVTLANMCCLLLCAFKLGEGEVTQSCLFQARCAHVLKHVSMLDVFIMGIIVCTAAGMNYKDQGMIIEIIGKGLVLLIISEVLHYSTYFLVTSTVEHLSSEGEAAKPLSGEAVSKDS